MARRATTPQIVDTSRISSRLPLDFFDGVADGAPEVSATAVPPEEVSWPLSPGEVGKVVVEAADFDVAVALVEVCLFKDPEEDTVGAVLEFGRDMVSVDPVRRTLDELGRVVEDDNKVDRELGPPVEEVDIADVVVVDDEADD